MKNLKKRELYEKRVKLLAAGKNNGRISGSEGKEKSYMQQNCDSRENQKKMLVQGRLLLKKKAKDGMTLAIAEREWSVRFDET